MLSFLIFSIFSLLIPALIVVRWRKHPMAAFITAAIILYLSLILPGFIKTFQAMMIYGTGDPELMASGISHALTASTVALPFLLPLLALIQWAARVSYKRSLAKKAAKATEPAFE